MGEKRGDLGGDKKLSELIRLIKQGKSRIWVPCFINLIVRELDTGKGVLKMAKIGTWKPWELDLLKTKMPIAKIAKKTGRTRSAIKDKRYRLRHPERAKQKRRRLEVRREKKLYGKKAKYRGWTYLDDAELVELPWSQKAHLAYAAKHKRTYAGVKARRAKLSLLGVKSVNNLKGIRFITAEGEEISLDKYIKDKQVVEDVQHLYQQEISERHRSRGKVVRKHHMPAKEGVTKRVRRLTKEEIRKEYGMKEAPHTKQEGGLRADCLWLIRHNSPITAARAAEVLEQGKSSISGIFSNLFSILGGDFIERTSTKPFEYRPLHHYDVKVAYKELTKRERQKMQEKRAKARGEEPPAEPEEEPRGLEEEIENLHAIHQKLKTTLDNLATATVKNLKELAEMIELNSDRIITLGRTQQEWLESGVGQGGAVQTLRVEFIFGWKK